MTRKSAPYYSERHLDDGRPEHVQEKSAHNGDILCSHGGFDVIRCERCGFTHLDPIPSAADLDAFYRDLYFQDVKSSCPDQESREQKHLRIAYSDRVRFFEQATQGRRLLDVGSGTGDFIRFAASRAWSCTGIEPSSKAAPGTEWGSDTVFYGTFDEFTSQADPSASFDVIHLKNVLEHLRNPAETLLKCRHILSPTGILFIEVPNDFNRVQEFVTRNHPHPKPWIAIPDHINYFTFSSCRSLLARCGFIPLKEMTSFPMYGWISLGLDFINHPAAGAKGHRIRVVLESALERSHLTCVRQTVYSVLARAGIGRTAIFYAQPSRHI